ncbi:putative expressed protein [Lyophyllum shimeji]|uniref:Expressed protein n=1 Tax=Lyophyllum shimeji TaxID=47721 RepID=A0A9P3UKT0_LYOSH|nr:putative expressed protein [Lyophyllum shimeji]
MALRASSLSWLGLLLLLTKSEGVSGAASCPAGSFTWTFNSRGEDPCAVASKLENVCAPGTEVLPLGLEGHYDGPTLETQNRCTCSAVVYSLVSACAECQNGTSTRWSQWSQNCNETSTTFPVELRDEVEIPPWAYAFNPSTSDTFDLNEITRPSGPVTQTSLSTTSPTPSSSVDEGASSQPGSTTVWSSASGSGKTPKLLGGIIGGFVGLTLLLAALLWWLVRRRRARSAPSALYRASQQPLDKRPGSLQLLRAVDLDDKDGAFDAPFTAVHSPDKTFTPT